MRRLLTLFLAVSLLLPAPLAARRATDLFDAVRPLQFEPNGTTRCTVTLINRDRGYWLTAAHCVHDWDWNDDSGSVTQIPKAHLFIAGEPASVHVATSVHPGGDMAVLFSPTAQAPRALKMSVRPPVEGDRVRMVGYPAGSGPFLTEGRVGSHYQFFQMYDEWLLAFDMAVCGGNSGSAVVNSKDEVISVMTRYYVPTPPCTPLSAGTPYWTFRAFAGIYFAEK